MTANRHIPLPGTFNLRDLGGYETPRGMTAWRQLLRSDSLHRLDPEALAALRDLGISTVIDLRHDKEIKAQPNPFAAAGARYVNLSLFEGLDPTGNIARDADNLLLALYIEALRLRGPVFAGVFREIAAAPGSVLFHCTAGKDRTGVIAAFALLIAGVAASDVVRDYALTSTYSPAMFAALEAELQADGKRFDPDPALLLSEAETMCAFIAHLEEAHGGAVAYLLSQGMTQTEIERLQARLILENANEGVV